MSWLGCEEAGSLLEHADPVFETCVRLSLGPGKFVEPNAWYYTVR